MLVVTLMTICLTKGRSPWRRVQVVPSLGCRRHAGTRETRSGFRVPASKGPVGANRVEMRRIAEKKQDVGRAGDGSPCVLCRNSYVSCAFPLRLFLAADQKKLYQSCSTHIRFDIHGESRQRSRSWELNDSCFMPRRSRPIALRTPAV